MSYKCKSSPKGRRSDGTTQTAEAPQTPYGGRMRAITTVRGYDLPDVVSALQKATRRGDGRIAGYFAIELFESGFAAYAWRRLLTISAEDCAGLVTQEVKALYDSWLV